MKSEALAEGVDLRTIRRRISQRRREAAGKRRARFEQAWRDFETIVAMIIREYHPLRIYQWGSLLHENHFSEISDIDIAVEGVFGPAEFFGMYGKAERLTSFPLDLIEIDRIDAATAQLIRRYGRLVYERPDCS